MAERITISTSGGTDVLKVGPTSAVSILTESGDILYRDTAAARLPIGSNGQILRVNNGLPAWSSENVPVSSVNGLTGSVQLASNDIGKTIIQKTIFDEDFSQSSPDIVNLVPYYSGTRQGINAVVVFSSEVNYWATIVLPNMGYNDFGSVTVRAHLLTSGPQIFVKVSQGSAAEKIYPPAAQLFDEVNLDRDYTFTWDGSIWRLEFLHENSTIRQINVPNYNGTLAAYGTAKPSLPTSAGVPGQLSWGYDDGAERLYICVAANTWRRVPISTWT